MPLTRLIVIIIGIYLAYKFIFDFLIPIYKTSKRMQQQFKGMHDQMNQTTRASQHPFADSAAGKPKAGQGKASKKDYIDFEEIK